MTRCQPVTAVLGGGYGRAAFYYILYQVIYFACTIVFHSLMTICCNISRGCQNVKGTQCVEGIQPFWRSFQTLFGKLQKGVGPSSRASEGLGPSGSPLEDLGHAFWKG
jgi:hypothetical protein